MGVKQTTWVKHLARGPDTEMSAIIRGLMIRTSLLLHGDSSPPCLSIPQQHSQGPYMGEGPGGLCWERMGGRADGDRSHLEPS